ncbi:hypothetical protein ACX93W_12655 [Paenibacillus sp. CAU 1782]
MTRLSAKIVICFLMFAAIMASGAFLHNRLPQRLEPPFIMSPDNGYAPKTAGFSGSGENTVPPASIYRPFFQPRQYVRILPSDHFPVQREPDSVQDSSTINSFDK